MATSLSTKLRPGQWRLMLTAFLHDKTPVVDIPKWLKAADAPYGDLLDLEAERLVVVAAADGEPVSLPDDPPIYGSVHVGLSWRGLQVTRTRIVPQARVLQRLAGKPSGVPLRQMFRLDAVDINVLVPLDKDGFFRTYQGESSDSPVSLEEASVNGRRVTGIQLRITEHGGRYVAQ